MDFGGEADMVSSADEPLDGGGAPKKWNYRLRGFFRAPLKVGVGPKNDGTSGHEFHSPARIVGAHTDEWTYVGLAPDPTMSLWVSAENRDVVGTVILAASTFYDAGYSNLDQMGGASQAYVTLRFHEVFGNRGGLAWTVGAFSNRYGMAGPRQQSSGFYGTYLFGRTHVAGEALTADIDLSDDLELVLEHGVGAKLEFIPFIPLTDDPARAPYLPEQGPVPQGSNYVNHAHASLMVQDWMTVGAHYLSSWSPNDLANAATSAADANGEARLTVLGGDVHIDTKKAGNAYVGYSHVDGKNLLPLADGVQVLHGGNGESFARNYFGPSAIPDPRYDDGVATTPPAVFLPVADGKVDTVMGQYMLHLAPLMGREELAGPDVVLALFGMYNHVASNPLKSLDKMKFGGEIQVAPIRYVSIGARFDRVMPDGNRSEVAYSAFSPRVIVHTNFLSREYVMINYTRYFLGSQVTPSAPYDLVEPDPDLFTLSAQISF